jgi:hypothetical protein
MRGLEAMGGVGGTQLSGLHGEGDQAGGESEQSDWITEEAANQWNPLWMNATRLVVVRTCKLYFTFRSPPRRFVRFEVCRLVTPIAACGQILEISVR